MKSMLKRELKSDAWQEELQAKMSKIHFRIAGPASFWMPWRRSGRKGQREREA